MSNVEKMSSGFTIVTISSFLLFLNMQMLLVSTPLYLKDQFQASDPMIGLVTGLFAASAIVARIYAGRPNLMDKMGTILTVGFGIALIASLGLYWCHTIFGILLMRMLYGFGFGLASTALPTIASNLIPEQRMGEGMGYFGFSNTMGLMLGPMLGLFLLNTYHIEILVFTASALLAGTFPLMFIILPAAARGVEKLRNNRVVSMAKNKYFSRTLLVPCILNVLMYSTYSGLISFIVLFGQERSIQGIESFFMFSSLVVLLVRSFAGKIFDKKGPGPVIAPGAILIMIGLILFSFSTSMKFVILSAVVYGSGYGILQPSIQAWMISRVSKEERGLANGLFYNSLDVGVVTGAIVLGAIASRVGYVQMYQLSALFMVLFIIILGHLLFKEHRSNYSVKTEE